MSYCEVCRVVQMSPTPIPDRDEPVQQMRVLREDEYFAFCVICARTQIFVAVEEPKE